MKNNQSKVRFPYKTLDRFAKISLAIGLLSILPVVMSNLIDHTIHGMQLTWIGLSIGLVLSLLIILFLKKRYPNPFVYDKLNIHTCIFVGFMALCPAVCHYINIGFANPEITCQSYTVVEKISTNNNGRHISISPTYFIFINIDNKHERFEIFKSLYDELHEGGKVELYVKHGALGFDYVEKFEAPLQP